jgi:hypothetical protein
MPDFTELRHLQKLQVLVVHEGLIHSLDGIDVFPCLRTLTVRQARHPIDTAAIMNVSRSIETLSFWCNSIYPINFKLLKQTPPHLKNMRKLPGT